jgi:nucleotide-binding universal stress UspA family protein
LPASRAGLELENVMIAWDHSAHAAGAVGDALPVLQTAASVRVVTVADEKTDAIVQSGTALVDNPREHGVHVSFEAATSRGSSIGKVLRNWANSPGMDAIVMGAYHHSPLNEIVWGGVTTTVIGEPPCWVMISH